MAAIGNAIAGAPGVRMGRSFGRRLAAQRRRAPAGLPDLLRLQVAPLPYGFAFLYVAHQGGTPFEEHYFHRANAAGHEGRLEQILDL
jgi:hypothetical protein